MSSTSFHRQYANRSTLSSAKIARAVPELQMPFMTLVGKADALIKVGRMPEAEELITATLAEATKKCRWATKPS